MAKQVDLMSAMRGRPRNTPPSLPGVLSKVAEEEAKAEQPELKVVEPEPTTPEPKEPAPKEKGTFKAGAEKPKAPARKEPTSAQATKAKAGGADAGKNAPKPKNELKSLDGRPAHLWDVSHGELLPEGWAAIALERVSLGSRRFRAERRNTALPDTIYNACNDYIYEQARTGGLDLTLSNIAEAAFEQIPMDDADAIQRLLDGLPDVYFTKSLPTRPRTFQLLEPTLDHMQNLARMLRAQGFTGKTGLVQAAVIRELLMDLGVEVD